MIDRMILCSKKNNLFSLFLYSVFTGLLVFLAIICTGCAEDEFAPPVVPIKTTGNVINLDKDTTILDIDRTVDEKSDTDLPCQKEDPLEMKCCFDTECAFTRCVLRKVGTECIFTCDGVGTFNIPADDPGWVPGDPQNYWGDPPGSPIPNPVFCEPW